MLRSDPAQPGRVSKHARHPCSAFLPSLAAWTRGPPARTAGERGERNEAGEGLAAVTHKIDQFSLHTALGKAGMAGMAGTG